MSPREQLEAFLSPAALDALERLQREIVRDELLVLAANRIRSGNRTEYLSVREASDFLRCDRQRVYDLLSAGRLTRHKDGSRVLIRRTELEAHVANGQGRS